MSGTTTRASTHRPGAAPLRVFVPTYICYYSYLKEGSNRPSYVNRSRAILEVTFGLSPPDSPGSARTTHTFTRPLSRPRGRGLDPADPFSDQHLGESGSLGDALGCQRQPLKQLERVYSPSFNLWHNRDPIDAVFLPFLPGGLLLGLCTYSGNCNSKGGSEGTAYGRTMPPCMVPTIGPEEADLQGYLAEHYQREGTVCTPAIVNSSPPQKGDTERRSGCCNRLVSHGGLLDPLLYHESLARGASAQQILTLLTRRKRANARGLVNCTGNQTSLLRTWGRILACYRFAAPSDDVDSYRNRYAETYNVHNVFSDSKRQPSPTRVTAHTACTDPAGYVQPVPTVPGLLTDIPAFYNGVPLQASKLSLPLFPDGQLACMQSRSRILAGVMAVSKLKMLVRGIERSCGNCRS